MDRSETGTGWDGMRKDRNRGEQRREGRELRVKATQEENCGLSAILSVHRHCAESMVG